MLCSGMPAAALLWQVESAVLPYLVVEDLLRGYAAGKGEDADKAA